ncbi:MAG: DUF255 domain-containing protein [Bacteroidetes bacterium]|nr:DUF255 domain-containing protein [Bacteroidota bacterium]
MKQLISVLLLLLPIQFVFGQKSPKGIRFQALRWEEALKKAVEEDKLIFLDAFTSWCAPCKKMNIEVFPQKEVGDFFNDRFINVKLNMEMGDGIQLAKKHHISAYPTFLFFDGKGKIIHRAAGYFNAAGLLELGKDALHPENNLSAMQARYESKERDPEFLYQFAKASYLAMDGSHPEIAAAYLETQSDWNTDKNLAFVFQFTEEADGAMFNYLLKNQLVFEKRFGKANVVNKIQELIYQKLSASDGSVSLKEADALFKKVYPDRAKQLSDQFRVTYYRQTGNGKKFAKAAIKYNKKYPTQDADELSDLALAFFELVDNKKKLKKALQWAEDSVLQKDSYFNNDTLAALYFKLGQKQKAMETAEKAISIAKRSGEDYSLTEELLEQIRSR